MPSPIQVICTDFDGTVFAEFEQRPIADRFVQVVRRLQAQGAKWVVNTGRDLSSLMEALGRSRIPVRPDYLVLVEREIYVHNGSRYESLRYWNDNCRAEHDLLFRQLRLELPRLRHWMAGNHQATLYEDAFSPLCVIADSREEADRIHLHLSEFATEIPCLAVVRNDVYLRFCHTSYNKGTALSEIREILGVHPQETFVAGDHFNDIPMLHRHRATWLGAPANAIFEVQNQVREQGGFISALPVGEGVAEALEWSLQQMTAGRRPTADTAR